MLINGNSSINNSQLYNVPNKLSALIYVFVFLLLISPNGVFGKEKIFRIFDETYYKNKPNLTKYGIEPIHVFYTSALWTPGTSFKDPSSLEPDEKHLKSHAKYVLRKFNPNVGVIDIEFWPTFQVTPEIQTRNIHKLMSVLRTLKFHTQTMKLGFYGLLPHRNYWAPVQNKPEELIEWYRANEAVKIIAHKADYIFPSLYTFYNDQDGWVNYAKSNLAEARKYGKPIYPFIWPKFHNSNKQLGNTSIPGKFWRKQLEIIHQYADGVVIWDADRSDWNENAEWWKETKLFIASKRKISK